MFDEAQDMSDDDLEALLSTSSAGPLGNPQWIFTGTPPGPRADGTVFTRVRTDALGPKPKRISWHEWSCEPQVDVDALSAWQAANPALRAGRLQLDVLKGERARFSEGGFKRERLGMWPETVAAATVIPAASWQACTISADPDTADADDRWPAPASDEPPTAMAVDMSPDRAMVVAGCWKTGERSHVELLALDYVADPFAALDYIVEAAGRRIPVVIDRYSEASKLVPELEARKVTVKHLSAASDVIKACAGFLDDVTARRLTHAGQEALDLAATSATKRKIGDAGGWGWDRRDPTTNLAPLVAVSLARYGAATTKPRSTRSKRIVVMT